LQRREDFMGVPQRQVPIERSIIFCLGLLLILAGIALFVLAFFTTIADFGEWFGMNAQQTSLALNGLGGVLLAGFGGILMKVGVRGWAEKDLILDLNRTRPDLGSWSGTGGGMPRDALAELDLPQSVRDRLDKQEPRLKVKCGKCQAHNHVGAKYCYACSACL
jgi:hypothetical protein